MRKFLIAFLLVLLPSAALAVPIVAGTATSSTRTSGVNGENLQDTPRTDSIPVGKHGGIAELAFDVTRGTSATMTASCEHSSDDSTWVWMGSTNAAGTSIVAVITYDLTLETKLTLTVVTKLRYVRCTLDDAANGSGTIIILGNITPDRR